MILYTIIHIQCYYHMARPYTMLLSYGKAIYNAIIILSCRGNVDRSHYYIRNHNMTTAGSQPMPLSYCHAVAMLIDPIITYGTTT